jgi:hypothetical protein
LKDGSGIIARFVCVFGYMTAAPDVAHPLHLKGVFP